MNVDKELQDMFEKIMPKIDTKFNKNHHHHMYLSSKTAKILDQAIENEYIKGVMSYGYLNSKLSSIEFTKLEKLLHSKNNENITLVKEILKSKKLL